MPGKDKKQHQPLPWPRREILVRDLLAQVCEIHRHQLALKELREIREARETPNNTSAAGGIGGCGIILDAGAAENGLRR